MTTLSDFDDDERDLIVGTPGAVLEGAVVADGQPSPMEFLRELSAGARVFKKAQRDENRFVREVALALRERRASGPSGEGLPVTEEATAKAFEQTENVFALLRERAAQADVEAYGAWLVRIATRVAEAARSKEGGFFSRKVAVTEAERAFIERIGSTVKG